MESAATAGRTAGAAAREVLVQKVLARIEQWGATVMRPDGDAGENVFSPLPPALRR